MSEQKLIEVAKWLNSKGYYIEFETDELWMEDELTEHRFRDICELLDEYAHDRIRAVAHEAVEHEKAWTVYDECYAVDHVCDSILSRIESKL